MAAPTSNGRVDVLIERVSNLLDRQEAWERRLVKVEEVQDDQGTRITRIEERQGIMAGVLGTLTLAASAISTYVGTLLK